MADEGAKRREERVKLVATALSNVGVAAFVAGLVAPALFGKFQPVTAAVSACVGIAFHIAAQRVLHYVVADRTKPKGVAESALAEEDAP